MLVIIPVRHYKEYISKQLLYTLSKTHRLPFDRNKVSSNILLTIFYNWGLSMGVIVSGRSLYDDLPDWIRNKYNLNLKETIGEIISDDIPNMYYNEISEQIETISVYLYDVFSKTFFDETIGSLSRFTIVDYGWLGGDLTVKIEVS